MSSAGRGRGYTGRHHLREPRPGDPDRAEEDVARALAELSPRSTGRGRGYSGRHRLREPRPGDPTAGDDVHSDLSPWETDLSKVEIPLEPKDQEPEVKEDQPVREASPEPKYRVTADDADLLQDLLHMDEQFAPLLVLLEQFSPGEDGIQFNRKLRQFETTVTSICPDEARLQQAFATFRAAALQSSVTSRKLAAVGASFTRQQRQQLLRGALLNVVMQGTFTKLDLLERANPLFLINAANLMGDYFAEARLCNGNKVHILASPLLQYMRALLASDDIRAHRSLATQLMQNGRELLSVLSQELDDLSISIRLRLLSPPPVSIIWLLLSADLCLNKFLPLPNQLQQFYAAHLDLSNDDSYSEVSYGSWKKSPEKDEKDPDKVSQNLSQISLNNEDDTKPKLRPILGAGAGLLRQEQALQDNFDTWTSKTNLTKRYDLNSWRQGEEEKKEEVAEPVFNPSVLPPNMQSFPVTVPDYPPPNRCSFPNSFPNYLQQGDGTYIQNQFVTNSNYTPQGDFVQFTPERPNTTPERVNNEMQKSSRRPSVPPVENWRKEKPEVKEDSNKNKTRNWTRQRSTDNLDEDEDKLARRDRERQSQGRLNRRNSGESDTLAKTPPRRHVTEVPRNQKYWDHDDRCDKDYNS